MAVVRDQNNSEKCTSYFRWLMGSCAGVWLLCSRLYLNVPVFASLTGQEARDPMQKTRQDGQFWFLTRWVSAKTGF